MLQTYRPENADLIVNINGRLVHRDEAGVSPFDSSVQNGDAVWEGLRLYNGRVFRLQAHLDRLRRSAAALSYASIPTDDGIRHELRRTLEANAMTDGVHIRLTLSRGIKYTSGLDPRINNAGHSLFILAEHKPPVYDNSGVRLITSSLRRPPTNVLDQRIHSCNQLTSILAKIEANAAGVDDALMLDTRGFLAETNATHVFIVLDGVVTTSTTCACPEGITRDTVLEICRTHDIPHEVRDVSPEEIRAAPEVFCTGTMGEIIPVIELDGQPVGAAAAGAMTMRIAAQFRQLTRVEGEVV